MLNGFQESLNDLSKRTFQTLFNIDRMDPANEFHRKFMRLTVEPMAQDQYNR